MQTFYQVCINVRHLKVHSLTNHQARAFCLRLGLQINDRHYHSCTGYDGQFGLLEAERNIKDTWKVGRVVNLRYLFKSFYSSISSSFNSIARFLSDRFIRSLQIFNSIFIGKKIFLLTLIFHQFTYHTIKYTRGKINNVSKNTFKKVHNQPMVSLQLSLARVNWSTVCRQNHEDRHRSVCLSSQRKISVNRVRWLNTSWLKASMINVYCKNREWKTKNREPMDFLQPSVTTNIQDGGTTAKWWGHLALKVLQWLPTVCI